MWEDTGHRERFESGGGAESCNVLGKNYEALELDEEGCYIIGGLDAGDEVSCQIWYHLEQIKMFIEETRENGITGDRGINKNLCVVLKKERV